MVMHNLQKNVKGVKGVMSTDNSSSPGKDHYVRQVAPDRHQATKRHNKVIRIGTWNVRTMLQCGKLENVKQEMARLEISILGVCETWWKHTGDIQTEGYRMLYSGGETHKHGLGIILDEKRAKCVMGHWELSDRVILVKPQRKSF